MTVDAVQSARANYDDLMGVLRPLTGEEWAAPSGAEGWRVQEVLAHVTSVFKM